MHKKAMRSLMIAGVGLCLLAGPIQAQELPEPKKNPFSMDTGNKVQSGLTEDRVRMIISEQIQMEMHSGMMGMPIGMGEMGPNGELPAPEKPDGTLADVLASMDLVGQVDGIYIYKDKNTGCYLNEQYQSEMASVVERRCYERVAERLHNGAKADAENGLGAGNPANQ